LGILNEKRSKNVDAKTNIKKFGSTFSKGGKVARHIEN